jgi:hypothetical protein
MVLNAAAATVIALFNLVASGLIGVAAGFVVCLVFRLSWNVKVAALDLLTALVASIASVYPYSAIANNRGYDSIVSWVLLTASAVVVLRHLARRVRRGSAAPVKRS